MENKKITDLAELTAAARDDYLEIVDTSANTSKKISLENLIGGGGDGWLPVSSTWTYASATTINVPSGAAAIYAPFDKVKFTQHSVVKTGYVYPVSDTQLLFYAGSDFAIEDTATYPISAAYYSHQASPIGFTHWYNWTPTLTRLSGYDLARFSIIGKTATIHFKTVNRTVTGAGTVVVAFPFTAATNPFGRWNGYVSGSNGGMVDLGTASMEIFKNEWYGTFAGTETDLTLHFRATVELA